MRSRERTSNATRRRLLACAIALAPIGGCGQGVHNDHSTEATSGATQTTTAPTTTSTTPTGTTTTSTSTSTMGSSTTDASGPSTTDCGFVCFDDIEPPECSTFTQDCDEGFKCAPVDTNGDGAWDEHLCVELMGDAVHGEPCTKQFGVFGTDTCAKGHMCWGFNEQGEGTCVAHCTGTLRDSSCGPPCSYCVISGDSILALCFPECDPLLQDCSGDALCVPYQGEYVCVPDASMGMGAEGSPCEDLRDCNPGLLCADHDQLPHPDCGDAPGCCTPFCDLSEGAGDQNPTCQGLEQSVPGVECVLALPDPDVCFVDAGVCVIP